MPTEEEESALGQKRDVYNVATCRSIVIPPIGGQPWVQLRFEYLGGVLIVQLPVDGILSELSEGRPLYLAQRVTYPDFKGEKFGDVVKYHVTKDKRVMAVCSRAEDAAEIALALAEWGKK